MNANTTNTIDRKEIAWDYALGIIKVDKLTPSDEFLSLVEQEKKGEITESDILEYLHNKYKAKTTLNV